MNHNRLALRTRIWITVIAGVTAAFLGTFLLILVGFPPATAIGSCLINAVIWTAVDIWRERRNNRQRQEQVRTRGQHELQTGPPPSRWRPHPVTYTVAPYVPSGDEPERKITCTFGGVHYWRHGDTGWEETRADCHRHGVPTPMTLKGNPWPGV